MVASPLPRLSKICLALSGATREDNGQHATFRVKKRPFAYFVSDHHGNGIVAVWCKVAPGANTEMTAAEPDRYYIPENVGPRGNERGAAVLLSTTSLLASQSCATLRTRSTADRMPRASRSARTRLPAGHRYDRLERGHRVGGSLLSACHG